MFILAVNSSSVFCEDFVSSLRQEQDFRKFGKKWRALIFTDIMIADDMVTIKRLAFEANKTIWQQFESKMPAKLQVFIMRARKMYVRARGNPNNFIGRAFH